MFGHQERLNAKKIKVINAVSFLAGFAQAFFLYIMSVFFKKASGLENVGVFYLAAYLGVFLLLLNFHKAVKKWGKSDVFYLAIFLKMAVIVGLLLYPEGFWGASLTVLYIIFGNLEWVALDIIMESFSSDRMSGRIRGKFLTILNAGFFLGPLLSIKVLEKYDFYGIFFFLLIFNLVISLIAIFGLGKIKDNFKSRLTVRKIIEKVLKRKNIRRVFYISFTLDFFYALINIYTPLYLLKLGFGWDEIGIIFTFMLLPFILIQYPAGYLADKKTGEKEFLILSVLIMAFSTLGIYFIASKTAALWAGMLFATRVGAALMEIMADSYFYKRIDGKDVDLIDIFRTAKSLGFILSAFLSTFILFIFPIKAVFLLLAGVVFTALYPAIRLVDNRSEEELSGEK